MLSLRLNYRDSNVDRRQEEVEICWQCYLIIKAAMLTGDKAR